MMTQEIYNLLAENKPLPEGTLIRNRFGEIGKLSQVALEFANRCPNHMSDYVPFWIFGWRDLHHKLSLPTEDV